MTSSTYNNNFFFKIVCITHIPDRVQPTNDTTESDSKPGFIRLLDLAADISILWYIITALALIICCVLCCCLYYCHRTHKAARKIKQLRVTAPPPSQEKSDLNGNPKISTIPTFSSYTPNSNTLKLSTPHSNTAPRSPVSSNPSNISSNPMHKNSMSPREDGMPNRIEMGYHNSNSTMRRGVNNQKRNTLSSYMQYNNNPRKSSDIPYAIPQQQDFDDSGSNDDESAEETQEPVFLSPAISDKGSRNENSAHSMDVDDIQISPQGSNKHSQNSSNASGNHMII